MAHPSFSIGMSKLMSISDVEEDEKCILAMSDTVMNIDNQCEAELLKLNDTLDSLHVDERPKKGPLVITVPGHAPVEFLEEDPNFQKTLAEGGSNPSAAVDRWAVNRLNHFREFKGWDSSVGFEDLPAQECNMMLTKFFEQICKKDGTLYPTQTLMGLYRAFHRVLRRRQEVRVSQSEQDEPVFHMRESPLFKQVGIACVLAMERSKKNGANLPRKKASVISLADEATILAHSCTAAVHPRGLQRRAVYFLLFRFAIRGGAELHLLAKSDFVVSSDDNGRYVRYDERLSKNYKVGLERYQDEHFRPAVTSYDVDMVQTMESIISHLPIAGLFLFNQCIDSPRTHAWFSTQRVSVKKLSGIIKEIHRECGLLTEGISNKSGRTTCVTRMATEGVPAPIGMLITGHKSQGAYARYDRSTDSKVRAAQKCSSGSSNFDEKCQEETERFKKKVVQGIEEEDLSPNKRVKAVDDATGEGSTVSGMYSTSEVETSSPPHVETEAPAVVIQNLSPAQVADAANGFMLIDNEVLVVDSATTGGSCGDVEQMDLFGEDLAPDWVDQYDWDDHFEKLQQATSMIVNPVQALFNKVQSLNNCTISIKIGKFGG